MSVRPREPIQFAIVREDPEVELRVLDAWASSSGSDATRVLLIASAGDTALRLGTARPALDLTLVDPNPAQLDLVRRKLQALREVGRDRDEETWRRTFNIGDPWPDGLCARGNFESLFRGWASFLDEMVIARDALRERFDRGLEALRREADDAGRLHVPDVIGHRYWPVSFDVFFADAHLRTMFGDDAIQHAPAESYPRYFQARFERAFEQPKAAANPWLAHPLFGCFLDEAAPVWVQAGHQAPEALKTLPERMHAVEGELDAVADLGGFELVHLSNIFDWMARDRARELGHRLGNEMAPGAVVVVRQLNTAYDVAELLGSRFDVDEAKSARENELDRSFFYSRHTVAFHV